ncbi:UvrD-helicase domain-containing protein [Effusibacillus lacus]|uniref:DNA helicase UvrD n=1 Tax=Effusibacillus lacus TaxID=1348429 RepID=A0A292YKY7_9BACL|nr:UvrD-helicase domain-containing protein [Effusibacillus lacus]TCS70780.1 UvrD/REP helicase N-terminal domain-containing protein [Effusibacillus lacus]GAX89423.1 DNA helicase UvrD [Effusibacillus lacus]
MRNSGNEDRKGFHEEFPLLRFERDQDFDHVPLSFPMLNRLVELLIRENPSILKALRLTYSVVFFDEFQDTTFVQFELLRTAFDGSEAIFTAVGDDKQRIMVWAGAMPDAFAQFEQQFGAQRISLISNWRSHEDLVRIQHVIASRIDSTVEEPEARAERLVDVQVLRRAFPSYQRQRDFVRVWNGFVLLLLEFGNVDFCGEK